MHRHEVIDKLTNTDSTARKPGDAIPKEKFEVLSKRVWCSLGRIKGHVDKFIAHAATPESCAAVPVPAITLDELWKAHETLCRAASCLATDFLGDSFPGPLATPLFDQFAYIDRPMVTPKQVKELRKIWQDFEVETQRWNWLQLDESGDDMGEEYEGFLS